MTVNTREVKIFHEFYLLEFIYTRTANYTPTVKISIANKFTNQFSENWLELWTWKLRIRIQVDVKVSSKKNHHHYLSGLGKDGRKAVSKRKQSRRVNSLISISSMPSSESNHTWLLVDTIWISLISSVRIIVNELFDVLDRLILTVTHGLRQRSLIPSVLWVRIDFTNFK